MTEEEKKAVEESQKAATEKEALEKKSDGAKDSVDYKAELEKLQAEKLKADEEKNNYKQGMLNAKDQLKKFKKGETPDDDDDSDDLDEKVKAIVSEQVATIKSDLEKSTVDSLIGEYSDDPDEQALIKYHLENSVAKNGSIRGRIENAQLIANKKLLAREREELTYALKAKGGVGRFSAAGGSNQDVEKGKKEIFSPEVIAEIKKRGLDPEKVKEQYLKTQNK